MSDKTGIEWTEHRPSVRLRVADPRAVECSQPLSDRDALETNLFGQSDPWGAARVHWKCHYQSSLRCFGLHPRQHSGAKQLRSRAGHAGLELRPKVRCAPGGRAATQVGVVVQLYRRSAQRLAHPSNCHLVSHCPADGRVVRPQAIGVRDVDRPIRIGQPSQVRDLRLFKLGYRVRRRGSNALGLQSPVSVPVVLLLGGKCSSRWHGESVSLTTDRSRELDGRTWDQYPEVMSGGTRPQSTTGWQPVHDSPAEPSPAAVTV